MILAVLLGVVSGIVVDESTGAGVRKAEVVLVSGRQSQSVMTDAEGRFKFEAVTPGRFQVQVVKTGYEFREASGQGSKGWVEVGQGTGETGLRYLLRPLGLVAGRVVDADGDPVTGARLVLLKQVRRAGRISWTAAQGNASSDDRGEFRMFAVPVGKYVLGCSAGGSGRGLVVRTQRTGPVPVFFPDALDPESAQVLDIRPGTRMEGLSIKARTATQYMIQGRVTGMAGEQGMGVHITVQQASWTPYLGGGRGAAAMREAGEFTVGPLAPGTYTLFAQQMKLGSPVEAARRPQEQPEQLSGIAVVTLTDRDVEGVSLQLGQGAVVEGTVAADGEKTEAGKGLYVMVQSSDESGYAQGAEAKPDGTFRFTVGRPGKYFLQPLARWGDRYLASIRVGGEEMIGRELDLTYGSPGPVRLLYRKDGGGVEGTVKAKEDGVFGRMTGVVLWPVDEKLRPFPHQSKAEVSQQGTFAFKNVAPGEYLVFAATVNDQRVWFEDSELPKEVAEQAARVKVMAGSVSTVEIPLVQWPEQ